MKKYNQIAVVLAIISLIFFIICSLWGFALTSETLKALHFQLLQIFYPGFSFSAVGYLLGIVESFVYGYLLGLLFVYLHEMLCEKKDISQAKTESLQ